MTRFTQEFFAGNRQNLKQLFTGTAPIVIAAHSRMQQSGGEAFPFRQDSYFWYLTGLDEPDLLLVIDKEKEYLILPEISDVQRVFDGFSSDETIRHLSGIETILESKEGWKQLKSRLKRVQHIATVAPHPAFLPPFNIYTNPGRSQLIQHVKDIHPDIELLDIRPHLVRMRTVKQPIEIEAMKHALSITEATLKQALTAKKLEQYEFEYQIEAEITKGFRSRGAEGHAFAPIVAAGKNACTLHYGQNSSPIQKGDMIVIDVGARVDHYPADITRTVCRGEPTKRQQQVFDAVLDVQNYAIEALRPGVKLREYEREIEKYMGEKLRALGLIRTIDEASVRSFYPHATGHFLGVDTHDVGDYDRPLDIGAVVTVEPGIYIREEGIGVRIEDNVLISSGGATVLSANLPKTVTLS